MQGVKFTRAMRPYGEGDTALLPDAVAAKLIASGEATRHSFPAQPFSNGALAAQPAPVELDKRQSYRVKRG